MKIIICSNKVIAEKLLAHLLTKRIQANPQIILGLASGRTMERVYKELILKDLSFARLHSFNLDEYIGLPKSNPNSYWHYMHTYFFDHINIDPEHIHLPDGMAKNIKKAALDYEDQIKELGGIDTQILGIGLNGHIGFNEPQSSLSSRSRDKVLTQMTREQNAQIFGGDINKVPKRAITMGVSTILEARELILLATGEEKAKIVAAALEGPITSMVTASAIQMHPNCKIILDKNSASKLTQKEYHQQAFAMDPEWEEERQWINSISTEGSPIHQSAAISPLRRNS